MVAVPRGADTAEPAKGDTDSNGVGATNANMVMQVGGRLCGSRRQDEDVWGTGNALTLITSTEEQVRQDVWGQGGARRLRMGRDFATTS